MSFVEAASAQGWVATEPVVDGRTLDALSVELQPFLDADSGHGGVRNLLDSSKAVRDLARSHPVRSIAEAVLGEACFVVRALLFDKSPTANWKVVWHQDLTIAVRERREVPGYGPWSTKAGVAHVQPPPDVLEQMLAVRVHLDDCGVDNGPVRVVSGTHRLGRLDSETIEQLRAEHPETICVASRGAVLAFHPLLLHASSPATIPRRRRVLHFEFASGTIRRLPGDLSWRWIV
jgi:ectoine hydroxylase-related dioxygenase (phytanoyl-CoA dioxygenase family)